MLRLIEVFTSFEEMPKLSAFLSSPYEVSEEWRVFTKSLCEDQTVLGPLKIILPLCGVLLPVIPNTEFSQQKRSPCPIKNCLKWWLACIHSPFKSTEESEAIPNGGSFAALKGKIHMFRKECLTVICAWSYIYVCVSVCVFYMCALSVYSSTPTVNCLCQATDWTRRNRHVSPSPSICP